MKQLLVLTLFFISQKLFCQLKIDPSAKKEYLESFKNLSSHFKGYITPDFKKGLGLLYEEKTDTLNKKDIIHDSGSLNTYSINTMTGTADSTAATSPERDEVSKTNPFPLSCNCTYKKDTLLIKSGYYLFSGFLITIKLYTNKINAAYSEVESEDTVLQITLKDKKVHEITIPAQVEFLTLNKQPGKKTKELFGHLSITTGDYYSYINVWGFVSDYIYKRMRYKIYFKCNMKNSHKNPDL